MRSINIHDAKTHLSRLLEQVARGESFIIAKAGKPLAKMVPLDATDQTAGRRLGFLVGEIAVPADFDRIGGGEIEELFGRGGGPRP